MVYKVLSKKLCPYYAHESFLVHHPLCQYSAANDLDYIRHTGNIS